MRDREKDRRRNGNENRGPGHKNTMSVPLIYCTFYAAIMVAALLIK